MLDVMSVSESDRTMYSSHEMFRMPSNPWEVQKSILSEMTCAEMTANSLPFSSLQPGMMLLKDPLEGTDAVYGI
jgi:hypothetical protein